MPITNEMQFTLNWYNENTILLCTCQGVFNFRDLKKLIQQTNELLESNENTIIHFVIDMANVVYQPTFLPRAFEIIEAVQLSGQSAKLGWTLIITNGSFQLIYAVIIPIVMQALNLRLKMIDSQEAAFIFLHEQGKLRISS